MRWVICGLSNGVVPNLVPQSARGVLSEPAGRSLRLQVELIVVEHRPHANDRSRPRWSRIGQRPPSLHRHVVRPLKSPRRGRVLELLVETGEN